MSKRKQGVDILSDPAFRKSTQCDLYSKRIQTLDIPIYPIERVHGSVVSMKWLLKRGFYEPFMVNDSTQLGMKLPNKDTSLSDIASIIGPNVPIDVMEVGTQSEISGCTFGDYARYLEGRGPHHKTVNLISLEISSTPLSNRIQAPKLARELDWVDSLWPLERRARGDYPRVQKYCLCGMAGAYTDFHVDFGGTSVWLVRYSLLY